MTLSTLRYDVIRIVGDDGNSQLTFIERTRSKQSSLQVNVIMEPSSFEEAMITKYNLREKYMAEGLFVALSGVRGEKVSLVNLGIGRHNFVVSRLNLSGSTVDYDLVSVTPLSHVTLLCDHATRELIVSSLWKKPKVFQQCSGAKMDDVWQCFAEAVAAIRNHGHGDALFTIPLPSAVTGYTTECPYDNYFQELEIIKFERFVNDVDADQSDTTSYNMRLPGGYYETKKDGVIGSDSNNNSNTTNSNNNRSRESPDRNTNLVYNKSPVPGKESVLGGLVHLVRRFFH